MVLSCLKRHFSGSCHVFMVVLSGLTVDLWLVMMFQSSLPVLPKICCFFSRVPLEPIHVDGALVFRPNLRLVFFLNFGQ